VLLVAGRSHQAVCPLQKQHRLNGSLGDKHRKVGNALAEGRCYFWKRTYFWMMASMIGGRWAMSLSNYTSLNKGHIHWLDIL
jgi:hypothetical protein